VILIVYAFTFTSVYKARLLLLLSCRYYVVLIVCCSVASRPVRHLTIFCSHVEETLATTTATMKCVTVLRVGFVIARASLIGDNCFLIDLRGDFYNSELCCDNVCGTI